MFVTVEQFRGALPEPWRDRVTNSQINMVLTGSCLCVTSINELVDVRGTVSAFQALGIIAMPCFERGSDRLLSVTFLKK